MTSYASSLCPVNIMPMVFIFVKSQHSRRKNVQEGKPEKKLTMESWKTTAQLYWKFVWWVWNEWAPPRLGYLTRTWAMHALWKSHLKDCCKNKKLQTVWSFFLTLQTNELINTQKCYTKPHKWLAGLSSLVEITGNPHILWLHALAGLSESFYLVTIEWSPQTNICV